MAHALSQFRTGDAVLIEARDEFYGYVDGWKGRVVAVGPKPSNACHYQVPGGHAIVEIEKGEGPLHLLVPFDQLRLSV